MAILLSMDKVSRRTCSGSVTLVANKTEYSNTGDYRCGNHGQKTKYWKNSASQAASVEGNSCSLIGVDHGPVWITYPLPNCTSRQRNVADAKNVGKTQQSKTWDPISKYRLAESFHLSLFSFRLSIAIALLHQSFIAQNLTVKVKFLVQILRHLD